MIPKTILFSHRATILAVIVGLAFLVGHGIYFSNVGSGKDQREWFPVAVMFFPVGFVTLLSASAAGVFFLVFGWIFYGTCIFTLLRSSRVSIFATILLIFSSALVLNLRGCSQMLKENAAEQGAAANP